MKKLNYALSFILIFAIVFAIVGCTESVSANDTYVTLDINPSVELIVTPKEKVIYANPLNEDGEILLTDIVVVGLYLDEAIDLIIEQAIALGFIDIDAEETIVSVTAISKANEIGETIQNRVKEHVNAAFLNRAMMGRAEDKGFTPEFITTAETYGVTPGFLFLAQSVVLVDDTILLEDALLMEQDELMAILRTAKTEMREVAQALKADFMEARQLIHDTYLPLIQDLEAQIEVALAAEEDTTELVAELEALQTEMHDAIAAIRDDFHEQTEALRIQIHAQRMLRIQEHRQDVESFMNQMEHRRSQMLEEIEEYQGRRP